MSKMIFKDELDMAFQEFVLTPVENGCRSKVTVRVVDAEPVVRCGECKYCTGDFQPYGVCTGIAKYAYFTDGCRVMVPYNHFCSWGER